MKRKQWPLAAVVGVLLASAKGPAAQAAAEEPTNPAASQELPKVIIIGNAPLPGLGLPLEQVPSNVQSAGAQDLQRQQPLSLAQYLNENFSGINVAENQANPFQPDVNYHGFTASPLLGTPEGLSVFVDGVRVNESFGDTVNWDLIPENAIANVTLTSGSNPIFGLNTLGGALAVQTRSGHDFPGTEIQADGGFFGRRQFQAQTGGSADHLDFFLAGTYFDEDGWRDFSPSKVKQLFGKAGWQDEQTDVDVSYAWADTDLVGNGAVPESLLAIRRSTVYTVPDETRNRLNFVSGSASHFLRPDLLVSANACYRHLTTGTANGDLNDNFQSDTYAGSAIDCTLPPTANVQVAYCADGINRGSNTVQKTWGVGAQVTDSHDLGAAKNQLVLGAGFDHSSVAYNQSIQYATVTDTHATDTIVDPNNPVTTVTAVGGSARTVGLYATDTVSPLEQVHITAAVRYNHIQETLNGYSVDHDVGDYVDPNLAGPDDTGGYGSASPVFGNHTYARINPSLGVTYTPTSRLTLYANYNEGSRAPTVIELGCSDPAQPCGLPNSFSSDPDLAQVVARTVEIGARGKLPAEVLQWSADLFRTNSSNDIQFISTSTSQGYFANVGTTRRQGLDAAIGGRVLEKLTWHLAYSFVDATYRSSFLVSGGSNSTADADGNIQVSPGNRIPLIARHSGRLRLDYTLNPAWEIGAALLASSGSYLRGNENNANVPDGVSVLGSGRIGGYTVVNLQSTLHVVRWLDVFVRLDNLFDKHYATGGSLTSNAFNTNGTIRDPADYTNENSVSPAQPIAVFAGVRAHF